MTLHNNIIDICSFLSNELQGVKYFPRTNILTLSIISPDGRKSRYYNLLEVYQHHKNKSKTEILIKKIVQNYPISVIEGFVSKVVNAIDENGNYDYLKGLQCYSHFKTIIKNSADNNSMKLYSVDAKNRLDIASTLLTLLQAIQFEHSIVTIQQNTDRGKLSVISHAAMFTKIYADIVNPQGTPKVQHDFILGYLLEDMLYESDLFYSYNIYLRDKIIGAFVFYSPRRCHNRVLDKINIIGDKAKQLEYFLLDKNFSADNVKKELWENSKKNLTPIKTIYARNAGQTSN